MTPDQLRDHITASGLSISRWARDVAGRDVRSVQRWLSGETIVPVSAAQWLTRITSITATDTLTTVRVSVQSQR
jgi:hypothetical protein